MGENKMKQIELLKKYCNFDSEFDVYVLFAISRKKDNKDITNSQEVVFREVVKSVDNIEKKYTKLLSQCENYRTVDGKKLNFYIYCSVNARDVRKGYITFKQKLLTYEREMMYDSDISNQLKRIDSIWLSAIMKPEARSKTRRFMLDIDTKNEEYLKKILDNFTKLTSFIERVETKNGWHYICKPFDKNCGNSFGMVEVKTDAMFFLNHIQNVGFVYNGGYVDFEFEDENKLDLSDVAEMSFKDIDTF